MQAKSKKFKFFTLHNSFTRPFVWLLSVVYSLKDCQIISLLFVKQKCVKVTLFVDLFIHFSFFAVEETEWTFTTLSLIEWFPSIASVVAPSMVSIFILRFNTQNRLLYFPLLHISKVLSFCLTLNLSITLQQVLGVHRTRRISVPHVKFRLHPFKPPTRIKTCIIEFSLLFLLIVRVRPPIKHELERGDVEHEHE